MNALETVVYGESLATMTCGMCGCHFGIPEFMRAEKERTGGSWYCPNGHCRTYSKTELDRLREKLSEQTRVATANLQRAMDAEAAEQKAVRENKNLKRRVSAGTCPCCKRTFKQLSRHMTMKHPEYAK